MKKKLITRNQVCWRFRFCKIYWRGDERRQTITEAKWIDHVKEELVYFICSQIHMMIE